MKKKLNKDGEPFTQDDPDDSEFGVDSSISELIDMIDQKLKNKPKGKNLLSTWRSEVNNLAAEINRRSNRRIYSSV